MKLNIGKLPVHLRARMGEVADMLGFEITIDGYALNACEGDTLTVSFDGSAFEVTYPTLNQFFRALLLIKQNYAGEPFAVTQSFSADEFGIMVDCSRNAVKTVAHVKEILRHLALMGYNQLQLYTEDTYEVEGEPYFGYMRGRYSVAELKEIDDYALTLGIEVVPCIQTLAHLNQIFRWNAYAPINDCDDILLIGDERTYKLIDNMFKTLKKCFRSNKLHIGMDEAHMLGRGKYADVNGVSEKRSEIMLKHLNRVVDMAKGYGYQPMMWSDMFFRLQFGGKYVVTGKEQISPEVIALVPDGLRLVYWDYYNDEATYDAMLEKHKAFGKEVMFAGGAWSWIGFAPHNAWSITATNDAMRSCRKANVKNIMLTMWGDDGAECSMLALLPTLIEAAEIIYGSDNSRSAFRALTGVEYETFMKLDLSDVTDKNAEPHANNPSKYLLFNDIIGGLMDARVPHGVNDVYREHASALKAAEAQGGRYAYLFAVQRTLCDALSTKAELGLWLRDAYVAGDKGEIKRLIKTYAKPLVKKLESFYEAFTVLWEKENKPNGMETHDVRIGGLIARVEHCVVRLTDYASGKTDSIPEFDEPMLDPLGVTADTSNKGLMRYNDFARTVSANKLSW